MKLDTSLKELERQLSLCIKCKQCTYGSWPENLPACPINDRYKFFTYCGGGIIYLARGILLGLIEEDYYDEVLDVIIKCTSCQFCGQTCKLVKVAPPYQNVTDLIRLLKIHLVKKGIYVSDKHKETINFIKEKNRPFDVSAEEEKELGLLKRSVPNKGEVLLFPGCVTSYRNRENLKAVIEMLNMAGVDYQMEEEECCCGAPLLDLGSVDGMAGLVDRHLEQMRRMKIRKVVFMCPHCQETFKDIYPQMAKKELDFKLMFITSYLMKLIEEKRLEPLKSVPLKMSYHDPCYLGRSLGDFDSARGIFKKIPGLQFVEMRRTREENYCCGAGGGVKILEPENAMAIGQERTKDFMKTGSEVLTTSCPHCKSQFRDVNKSIGKNFVVKDVVEILRASLKE
jgi:heterodisulfide reductase subunit D